MLEIWRLSGCRYLGPPAGCLVFGQTVTADCSTDGKTSQALLDRVGTID